MLLDHNLYLNFYPLTIWHDDVPVGMTNALSSLAIYSESHRSKFGSTATDFARAVCHVQEDVVSIAGRIVNKREQGKLLFYTITADGANVQIMSSLGDYEEGEEAFWKVTTIFQVVMRVRVTSASAIRTLDGSPRNLGIESE